MKRWLYIAGILLIVCLISIWLFLLFADEDTKKDIYNTLGFQGSEEEGFFENLPLDIFPSEENTYQQLRQLTTRRTIGHTEVVSASSTMVLFVEAGTGHIYKVDPKSGQEERISNVTIPVAKEASIAPSGKYAVVVSETNRVENAMVVDLAASTPSSYRVSERMVDFNIGTDDILTYSTTDNFSLTGKSLNLTNGTSKTLFKAPFTDGRVGWGNTEAGQHLIYPKTSRFLEGYAYEPSVGSIGRLPAFGYGFSAIATESIMLYQKQAVGGLQSFLWRKNSGNTENLVLSFFPEKCAFSTDSTLLFCGYSNTERDMEFPDNWYRGEKKFSDEIWETNLETKETKLLVNPYESSGREIDIINLHKGTNALYFVNKNDQTLWVYDLDGSQTTE